MKNFHFLFKYSLDMFADSLVLRATCDGGGGLNTAKILLTRVSNLGDSQGALIEKLSAKQATKEG